ncbi:MAG: type II toxin-antitoxin system HicB family antitoxin [bacterium]|nr:type II toxin-antitoxin system HicB family antitoxin [bacterium]
MVTTMMYHAHIEQDGEWWIGWLVDLPGVNAQEKTREGLIESLKIGAKDMLDYLEEKSREPDVVTVAMA